MLRFSSPQQLTTDVGCGKVLSKNLIVALSPWGIPEVPEVPSSFFIYKVALDGKGISTVFKIFLAIFGRIAYAMISR